MKIVEIFKGFIKNYENYVLAKYEENYTPRILSNHNSKSKYYIIKLGKIVDGKVVSYNYSDTYALMPKDLDFELYAIKTNDRMTELFSGTPVSVDYNQPHKFEDVSLEDLEDMDKSFYAYNLEEITKEEMANRLMELMDKHMIRYYNEIFKTEYLKQQDIIESEKNLKKNQQVLKEVVDTIGYFSK